jgi:hypothetical protein
LNSLKRWRRQLLKLNGSAADAALLLSLVVAVTLAVFAASSERHRCFPMLCGELLKQKDRLLLM